MLPKLRKVGFTLAEVLITLAIVGVVAALTIPTLIQNTNNKRFVSQFKKAISTLSQAGRSAQAHYDVSYNILSSDSADSTCASDSLSAGNLSMCGLLNSTLSGHSYVGVYGTAGNNNTPYSFTKTTNGFDPSNYLMYQLSDGTIIGFNSSTKNCTLPSGHALQPDDLTGSLSHCIGFVDVNGFSLPNKEVTCADGTSTLDPHASCEVTKGNAIGDVFPVVFYNGTVEPATNSGRTVSILYGTNSGSSSDSAGGGSSSSEAEAPAPKKTITYKGEEYTLIGNTYFKELENGDLMRSDGMIFAKQPDGTYLFGPGSITCDKDLNILGVTYNGQWYDYKGGIYVRDDGNGNLVDWNGLVYTKTDDGYEWELGSTTYRFDNDLNILGRTKNGLFYDYKGGNIGNKYFHKDDNGNVIADGATLTKTSDGYQSVIDGKTYRYDNDLNELGMTYNGKEYTPRGSYYAYEDSNGNIVTPSSGTFTKRDDGLYEKGDYIYDENLVQIGPKN